MSLPAARNFSYGLGVSIHVNYPDNFDPQPLGPGGVSVREYRLGLCEGERCRRISAGSPTKAARRLLAPHLPDSDGAGRLSI